MFFKHFADEIIEPRIKLGVFFNHYLVDDFSCFMFHDLVYLVVDRIGRILDFLKQGV